MTALTRRSGRVLLVVALAVALLATSCRSPQDVTSSEVRSQANDGPNIVLISTDDQALVDLRWMPLTRRLIGDQGVGLLATSSPPTRCAVPPGPRS